MTNINYQDIEEAVDELRKGNLIIVTDDENRENEGDFIVAAELATPDIVNFMASQGRGLICVAITEQRRKELDLEMMVQRNTARNSTNFTVSVDLLGQNCTTGISSHDRAKTIIALANPDTTPDEFGRPGHIFPIKAHEGGVRVRPGHTEATIEFMQLAGLKPVGALVEILNPDGSMARYPDLLKLSKALKLKLVTIKKLIQYLDYKTTN